MGKRERVALAQVPLFQHLTSRHLKRIADLMEPERLMEGAVVVREGDVGDTFYVILEGQAQVKAASGRTVNRLWPGDFFGEISLLDGGERTATVVAETPLTVLTLPRNAFLKVVRDEPAVAIRLLGYTAALLRRLEHPTSG
jgi:CRP-like cAMP-binding protein